MSGLITAQLQPGSTIYTHCSRLRSVAMLPLLQLNYSDLENKRCFEGRKICSSRFLPSTQCGGFLESGKCHCPFWRKVNFCPVPVWKYFSLTFCNSDNSSSFVDPFYQFFHSCNGVRKQNQTSLSIVSVRYRFQTSITHARFCAVKSYLLHQWLLLFWMGLWESARQEGELQSHGKCSLPPCKPSFWKPIHCWDMTEIYWYPHWWPFGDKPIPTHIID